MGRRFKPDETPLHLKFGFHAHVEKKAIRDKLIAEGRDPADLKLYGDVERAYEAAHAKDPSYAEICAARNVRWAQEAQARFDRGESERTVPFLKSELEWLADHFEGANDPMAQAVLAKVLATLAR